MIIFIFITIRLLNTNGKIYTVMNIEYQNKFKSLLHPFISEGKDISDHYQLFTICVTKPI